LTTRLCCLLMMVSISKINYWSLCICIYLYLLFVSIEAYNQLVRILDCIKLPLPSGQNPIYVVSELVRYNAKDVSNIIFCIFYSLQNQFLDQKGVPQFSQIFPKRIKPDDLCISRVSI
jgi:hypothetical protein